MQAGARQQEILLVTTSSFSKREWCTFDENNHPKPSSKERLEEACWNGLLEAALPEIVERSTAGGRLYLWHIRHGKTFLQIELCESPQVIDKQFSIDTEFFLQKIFYS